MCKNYKVEKQPLGSSCCCCLLLWRERDIERYWLTLSKQICVTRVWVAHKKEWTVRPHIGREPSLQALPMAELSFIFQFSVTLLKTRIPRYKSGWPGLDCVLSPWPVSVHVCTCTFVDATKIPRHRQSVPKRKMVMLFPKEGGRAAGRAKQQFVLPRCYLYSNMCMKG